MANNLPYPGPMMTLVTLVTGVCFLLLLVAIYLINSKINQINKRLRFIEDDKAFKEIKRVLQESSDQGEGIFALKKLDDAEYYLRVKDSEFIRRGRKA